jgi:predicted metal-dependent HD superfamily phosphohydrolase
MMININFKVEEPYSLLGRLRDSAKGIEPNLLDRVLNTMMQKTRLYHGIYHLLQMWSIHQQFTSQHAFPHLFHPALDQDIAWVIIYHDSVCDGIANDNEFQSAELWNHDALQSRVNPEVIEWVYRAIMASSEHFKYRPMLTKDDELLEWFLGLDLASMASPPEEFDLNTQLIRMEFSHVSDEQWMAGRSGFLRKASESPFIFRHPVLHQHFEDKARANILRSLAT